MHWVLLIAGVIVGLIAAVAVAGLFVPKSHTASSMARYRQPPEALWTAITDFPSMPSWQPGLKSVERLPDQNGHPVWLQVSRHGRMLLEVIDVHSPTRLVCRIADPNLPFGGTWTYEIVPTDGGAEMTITENGEIYNPIFRFMARFIFGYHATLEGYLRSLSRKFGEDVSPARLTPPPG